MAARALGVAVFIFEPFPIPVDEKRPVGAIREYDVNPADHFSVQMRAFEGPQVLDVPPCFVVRCFHGLFSSVFFERFGYDFPDFFDSKVQLGCFKRAS